MPSTAWRKANDNSHEPIVNYAGSESKTGACVQPCADEPAWARSAFRGADTARAARPGTRFELAGEKGISGARDASGSFTGWASLHDLAAGSPRRAQPDAVRCGTLRSDAHAEPDGRGGRPGRSRFACAVRMVTRRAIPIACARFARERTATFRPSSKDVRGRIRKLCPRAIVHRVVSERGFRREFYAGMERVNGFVADAPAV